MKKYCFIINSLTGGGAERIMARLLSNSRHKMRDAELHLVLLDMEPVAYEVPEGIRIHQLDTQGSLIRGFFALWRVIGQIDPDVCLSFLSRSNFLTIVISRLRKFGCVISERVNTSSHHPQSLAGNISRLLTKLTYPRADRVIAVSDGIARDLASNYAVDHSKISVIPNPVDGAAVLAQAQKGHEFDFARPMLVGMGRLVTNKNFELLVDAYSKSGLPGSLVIMGEGPLRDDIASQIGRHGLEGRVHLLGFQANPFALISDADCYVLPSNGEGFPNGLIEAMVLGTPVISTNCHSGPSEILGDRPYQEIAGVELCKYGYLVPVNDADAMADAMKKALAPGQREILSAKSAEGAKRYDLAKTIELYWAEIEACLDDDVATSGK